MRKLYSLLVMFGLVAAACTTEPPAADAAIEPEVLGASAVRSISGYVYADHRVTGAEITLSRLDGTPLPVGTTVLMEPNGRFEIQQIEVAQTAVGEVLDPHAIVSATGGETGGETMPAGSLRAVFDAANPPSTIYVTPLTTVAVAYLELRPDATPSEADAAVRASFGLPDTYDLGARASIDRDFDARAFLAEAKSVGGIDALAAQLADEVAGATSLADRFLAHETGRSAAGTMSGAFIGAVIELGLGEAIEAIFGGVDDGLDAIRDQLDLAHKKLDHLIVRLEELGIGETKDRYDEACSDHFVHAKDRLENLAKATPEDRPDKRDEFVAYVTTHIETCPAAFDRHFNFLSASYTKEAYVRRILERLYNAVPCAPNCQGHGWLTHEDQLEISALFDGIREHGSTLGVLLAAFYFEEKRCPGGGRFEDGCDPEDFGPYQTTNWLENNRPIEIHPRIVAPWVDGDRAEGICAIHLSAAHSAPGSPLYADVGRDYLRACPDTEIKSRHYPVGTAFRDLTPDAVQKRSGGPHERARRVVDVWISYRSDCRDVLDRASETRMWFWDRHAWVNRTAGAETYELDDAVEWVEYAQPTKRRPHVDLNRYAGGAYLYLCPVYADVMPEHALRLSTVALDEPFGTKVNAFREATHARVADNCRIGTAGHTDLNEDAGGAWMRFCLWHGNDVHPPCNDDVDVSAVIPECKGWVNVRPDMGIVDMLVVRQEGHPNEFARGICEPLGSDWVLASVDRSSYDIPGQERSWPFSRHVGDELAYDPIHHDLNRHAEGDNLFLCLKYG